MNPWDILLFPFDRERRHPVVIVSNDETCQNSDIQEVNGPCLIASWRHCVSVLNANTPCPENPASSIQ